MTARSAAGPSSTGEREGARVAAVGRRRRRRAACCARCMPLLAARRIRKQPPAATHHNAPHKPLHQTTTHTPRMSRDQRMRDNWALLHALEQAKQSGAPTAVAFNLVPEFLGAGARQFVFMLKGLQELAPRLEAAGIPFFLLRVRWRLNACVAWRMHAVACGDGAACQNGAPMAAPPPASPRSSCSPLLPSSPHPHPLILIILITTHPSPGRPRRDAAQARPRRRRRAARHGLLAAAPRPPLARRRRGRHRRRRDARGRRAQRRAGLGRLGQARVRGAHDPVRRAA